ncbi:hypothetical protein DID80_06660 [Candidatus Marinamargulisbacteria bacterium SCGC AAA071-K20]|nr:hypothetical protein DID80_06660 [Candidatus Marinamargulisbacteria bacterium SCGC AAA071-K20]
MRRVFFILLFLGSTLFAESLHIIPEKSLIGFEISHIGRMEVEGAFSDFMVDLAITDNYWPSANVAVTINTSSLSTKNRMRDRHLKSDDFFDVSQFEFITFKSKSFFYNNDDVWVSGDLTIRGVLKTIEFPFFVLDKENGAFIIEARPTLNRFDFGMNSHKRTIRREFMVNMQLFIVSN